MHGTRRVLIIGGGIAGPTLGLFLARRGIEARVFEAYPPTPNAGAAFQIAPNGMRVLDALGLKDAAIARGEPSRGFVFRNDRGECIGVVRAAGGIPAANLTRAAVHELLEDAMQRAGVGLAYGRRLASVEEDDGGVTAVFEDGTRERGDVLIGADGVRSRVRAWMLPDAAAPRDTRMLSIGAFCTPGYAPPVAPEDHTRLTFVVGRKHQAGFMKMANATWAFWCHAGVADDAEREALLARSDDEMKAWMLARYAGWTAPVMDALAHAERWLRTSIVDVPHLPTWHRRRVALVGDAAHAMSSAGGQGASMALEDAMLLAALLADRPYAAAFATFEARRRVRAERMVKQAHANDQRTLAELRPAQVWLRDRVFMPLFAPVLGTILARVHAGDPALRERA